jgi:tetratricopeptide (TPR) repeat protein
MKTLIRPLILTVLLAPGAALAAGDSAPPVTRDPVMERVSAATAQKDWPAAQAVLRDALSKSPNNPDYHNMYAYSIRKGANPDLNLVFKHYNEALRLDPKHRGAHEYIGEAYLMVGNLPKAKEHLSTLDKLCFFPCEEFSDLKKAIGEFESGKRK